MLRDNNILLVEENINHCIYLYLLQKIQLFPDTECGMLGVLMDELQQAHMYAVTAKFSNDSVKMLLIGLLKIGLFKKKCYLCIAWMLIYLHTESSVVCCKMELPHIVSLWNVHLASLQSREKYTLQLHIIIM